jgi:hypothetical protein
MEFAEFQKIPRLSREIVVTEKIDGTNGSLAIFLSDALTEEDKLTPHASVELDGTKYVMFVGSRTRWISETDDNHGFAKWAYLHASELVAGLGLGTHYGEWWGQGIQRGYGLKEKRFSLFNTYRWLDGGKDGITDVRPVCCGVVPVLYRGDFDTERIQYVLKGLESLGSMAAPGFMNPEGVVIYHTAGDLYFKKTIKNDDKPKGQVEAEK